MAVFRVRIRVTNDAISSSCGARPFRLSTTGNTEATIEGDQICRYITAGANVNDIPTFFPAGYTLLLCVSERARRLRPAPDRERCRREPSEATADGERGIDQRNEDGQWRR